MQPPGEFALIERYFRRPGGADGVLLGIGDDAAIVSPSPGYETVLAVDMMVEGRHFLPGTDPERLGHKILAVNLSDLAAMGARPRHALLACALPDSDPQWLQAFARGLFALADQHGVALIGGDTTRGPRTLSLTAVGDVPAGQGVTRSGARVGDDIWVSGSLGDAMLALAILQGERSIDEASLAHVRLRLERPEPRVALGMALLGIASAMIDVSDGLVGDLGHVLEQSHAGARVDVDAVPRSPTLDVALAGPARERALQYLLAGGDDYELCFTAPRTASAAVRAAGEAARVKLSRIGTITEPGSGLVFVDGAGAPLDITLRAFDHFRT